MLSIYPRRPGNDEIGACSFYLPAPRFESGSRNRSSKVRIPMKPDGYSDAKPDRHSNLMPDAVPI